MRFWAGTPCEALGCEPTALSSLFVPGGRSWRVLLAALAGLGLGEPAPAQQDVYPEQVKAAFLYHFGTYVQWSDVDDLDTIAIAVLGADDVAGELAEFLPGRRIQSRPAGVRRIRSVIELDEERILFIGADESERIGEHVAALAGRPVLTVTDAPDGLADGAMINFRLVDRQVRFEISLPAAQEAGLMLSSRLLSAAMRVETARWPDVPRRRSPSNPNGDRRDFALGCDSGSSLLVSKS